ncbi:MAG: tetratricopeptide repeat protein, partial [Gammaproteobacteria bacterium]|nr:tetratricopeptide repeat protein [Gammaproteobacteria bacterium]
MWLQVRPVLALFFLSLGQYLSAAPVNALDADSTLRDDLVIKARVFQDQGYRTQAIALLQQADQLAKQLSEDSSETGLLLAQLYFELGEYPLSLNLITRTLDQSESKAI